MSRKMCERGIFGIAGILALAAGASALAQVPPNDGYAGRATNRRVELRPVQ